MNARNFCSKKIYPVVVIVAMMFVASCTVSKKKSADVGYRAPEYVGDPPVVISEIYVSNPTLKDEFGNDPGWVEFYNPHDSAVDLNGFYLTNRLRGEARRWRFGDVVVPPRERVLVFMSRHDIPDFIPAGDSIDLIQRPADVSAWADNANTPRGRSTVENKSVRWQNLGGVLRPRDNRPVLDWSGASIEANFARRAVIDLSNANEILLRGFITEGARLQFRIAAVGTNMWEGYPTILTGTGVDDDLYVIDLAPIAAAVDLSKLQGIRFDNIYNDYRMIEFNFTSIVARRRSSNIHASFTLANNGGTLFLMDRHNNIRDSVSYPARTLDLSFAKNFETQTWAHAIPTPHKENVTTFFPHGQLPPPTLSRVPNSGHYTEPLSFVIPQGTNGATIICDLTGANPTSDNIENDNHKNSHLENDNRENNNQENSHNENDNIENDSHAIKNVLQSGATVNITNTSVMRCAQFKDNAYPSEPVMRTYIIGRLPDLPIVSIAVDPAAMFDSARGLYSPGPDASETFPYFSANFWSERELPVQIEFFESGMVPAWTHRAGLRIFGGWSRGFDKKSALITFRDIYGRGRLNYSLFPDNPELTRFKHFILRNNGNNFPHDYIRDMMMTSLTEGLDIDYQRGRAVVVFYNGEYWGIHNLRERSNSDYFTTKYGIDEDHIDLVQVVNGGEVSRGSDADYQEILRWLRSLDGLSDENLRELDARIDVDNFTYNYMARMFYLDRDWPGNNMKRWRAHTPPSRWRFFMYDTDLGWNSLIRDNKIAIKQPDVSTMNFVTAPNSQTYENAPHATFMLRKLFENDNYRASFVNRFSLLMQTYFADERVNARIDELMSPIENEIAFDQERWGHSVEWMNVQMDTIKTFASNRRVVMQNELREFFDLSDGVDFTVSVIGNDNGRVRVHNLEVLNNRATFTAYPEMPVVLRAVSENGATFERWSDGLTDAERVVIIRAGENITLNAEFK